MPPPQGGCLVGIGKVHQVQAILYEGTAEPVAADKAAEINAVPFGDNPAQFCVDIEETQFGMVGNLFYQRECKIEKRSSGTEGEAELFF